MKSRKRPVIIILLCFFLVSFLHAGSADLTDVQKNAEKNSDIMTDAGSSGVHTIETGDVLEVVILGEKELSRTLVVMRNGYISMPLIGEVKVAGLTIKQAEDVIAEKLREYYTHPVVSVILKSPTLPYVSVFGEVLRPGAVEYQRGLRITDYIALAGGPTSRANLKKVKVVRSQRGEIVTSTIDVDRILKKGITVQNYELKSGDWIYVSKKFTINWTAVLQFATLALTAANLYLTIQRLD